MLKILELYKDNKPEKDKLWKNTRDMQKKLDEAGLDTGSTQPHEMPGIVDDDIRLSE